MPRSSDAKYRMIRVREQDYQRLKDAQRLIQAKGLDSIDWDMMADQKFVTPPDRGRSDDARVAALAAGFVIGIAAAALGALVAAHLARVSEGTDD